MTTTLGTETIDVINDHPEPGALWSPVVGNETLRLLEHLGLSHESRTTLQREAASVLARCVSPKVPNRQQTGLVIGYVQSGKTMSFTTVAALARDNGYRLIIVLSGLTRGLFCQSRDRLDRDLQTSKDRRRWLSTANPKARDDVEHGIRAAFDTFDPQIGPRTVLLTVMKNGTHLDQLVKLLSQLSLDGVPTLVIDDEADQASLNNNVRSGGESATYRRVVTIRSRLPHHTYLQYTATPQAPLLINLIDTLSPSFAEVLTPGSAYTGGRAFFEGNFDLVRLIHPSEVPSKKNVLAEPPASLLEALRVFFLGVAAGRCEERDNESANRSMMVHPSMQRLPHADYHRWVCTSKKMWAKILAIGEADASDLDYRDLVDDFRGAYTDLSATVEDIPRFEQLLGQLRLAISETIPHEVNSRRGQTPDVDWQQHYAHILVGGEVLNRGYTVEGLTVTYMPRGKGTEQADTIQQRARWFGYKEDYLPYCRVYLSDQTLDAYRGYVEHEENMREELRRFRLKGKPLREWKRAFFLSTDLKPTRTMVLDLDYIRGNYSHKWYDPAAPHDTEDALQTNRELVDNFVTFYKDEFLLDEGNPARTIDQIHLVARGLSLSTVYEDLLWKLCFTRPGDSAGYTGLLLQIKKHLEQHPGEICTVYQMKRGGVRERGLNDKDEIKELMQGQNPKGVPVHQATYPGDREIHAKGNVTIQLHRLRLDRDGVVQADNVPAVAVWLPKRMSADWLVQQQD